ncbi:cell division protein FtsQ/DivIB [Geopsychrobacter electrodiphilus]|uniref:cell division protein FtsQ/DivIB n=1 Tax=Geopsychrobacter electrodiphilus TaxID=225196 RepID=UPI000379D3FC|nr:FtsQ-type POTRA domain-containing protein [Geopsychrobacter electrodiphilus]
MHDLKANSSGSFRTGKQRVKENRKNKQKKPLNLRKILHRTLRVLVVGLSGALIVFGLVLVIQLLVASDLFRIDQVSITGEKQLSREKILALSDIQNGVSTFALDLALIGRKIEENPWVKSARVERIFPRQVNIQVEERVPLAIINLGYLYYLDQSGEVFKVLGQDDSLDFPVVTGFDRADLLARPEAGRQQLGQVVALIENLSQRKSFNLTEVSEIHQEQNGGLTLFTQNGGVKVKLGIGRLPEKLTRLERIYARLKPRLEMLEYIDLNVDKRIIVGIERRHAAAAS